MEEINMLIRPVTGDDQVLGIEALPLSLQTLVRAHDFALTEKRQAILAQREKIRSLVERKQLLTDIGFKNQRGIKTKITQAKNLVYHLELQLKALLSGYLEIPNPGWQTNVTGDDCEPYEYADQLSDAPIHVLKEVRKAQEAGCFERIQVWRPERGNDPIVFAIIGNETFYLASWK